MGLNPLPDADAAIHQEIHSSELVPETSNMEINSICKLNNLLLVF